MVSSYEALAEELESRANYCDFSGPEAKDAVRLLRKAAATITELEEKLNAALTLLHSPGG